MAICRKDLEVFEVVKNDKVLITAAKCYGFRNIQNLVQKLKRGKCTYNFVEVMACPSGCVNGGGQIRAQTVEARSSVLEAVIKEYDSLQNIPELENAIEKLTSEWMELNVHWKDWLFTEFHAVDKDVSLQTMKW